MKKTVVCPDCGKEFEVEVSSFGGTRKGQLSGIKLEDMTIEQLQREKVNASSVLSKAKKRNASPETIEAAQKRLDNVKARLAEVKATAVLEKAAATEDTTAEVVEVNETAEAVYEADEEL